MTGKTKIGMTIKEFCRSGRVLEAGENSFVTECHMSGGPIEVSTFEWLCKKCMHANSADTSTCLTCKERREKLSMTIVFDAGVAEEIAKHMHDKDLIEIITSAAKMHVENWEDGL